MSEVGLPPIAIAVHRLCSALHHEFIEPAAVEIHLPRKAWWSLQCKLEQHFRGFMIFDGRGALLDEFSYMGIRFKPKADR